MTVAMATVVTMATPFGDSENTINTSDDAADTGAEGTAYDTSNRPCRAPAFIRALSRSAFHASDHALRVTDVRNCEQSQRRCNKRKTPICQESS